MAAERMYTLKALTDIWTGSVKLDERNGELRERIVPGRLIATGLLGSIRWWFEVLVRGLGGSACDPSHHEDNKSGPCPPEAIKDPRKPGHRCVVCELFGCTGWARKFRFEVLDENGQPKRSQIKRGDTFKLRFTELRPICPEEWALLDLTLRLIAEYGAIGGKTVYKPSDEQTRQSAPHHRDYGLIKITDTLPKILSTTKEDLKSYVDVEQRRWRRVDHGDFSWASLKNFWCVKGRYLARQSANASTFNKVIGRDERKSCRDCGQVHNPPQKCPKAKKHPRRYSDQNPRSDPDIWLAGQQQESKKIFSFKNPPRTFGFVNPGTVDLTEMRRRLSQACSGFQDSEFLEGPRILDALFTARAGGTP